MEGGCGFSFFLKKLGGGLKNSFVENMQDLGHFFVQEYLYRDRSVPVKITGVLPVSHQNCLSMEVVISISGSRGVGYRFNGRSLYAGNA